MRHGPISTSPNELHSHLPGAHQHTGGPSRNRGIDCSTVNSPPLQQNLGAVLISDVAPGFSPASAALKGGATFKLGQQQNLPLLAITLIVVCSAALDQVHNVRKQVQNAFQGLAGSARASG